MSSDFNKEKLDKLVEEVCTPINEKDSKEKYKKEFAQEFKPIEHTISSSSMVGLKEEALIDFFDRLSNQNRKGTNREVRRRIGRWLDKKKVKFIEDSDFQSFTIRSPYYSTVLSVQVKLNSKTYFGLYHWSTWK